MKTIVGLYQDKTTANQVVQELVNYGISQDIVNLVTSDVSSDLGATLVTQGVDATEAQAYVEGVRQGHALVAVQVDDDSTNDVVAIMNRYRPIDVHNLSTSFTRATAQQTTANAATPQRATTKQATKSDSKSQQALN